MPPSPTITPQYPTATPTLIRPLRVFEGNYKLLLPVRSTRAHNRKNCGRDWPPSLWNVLLGEFYTKILVGYARVTFRAKSRSFPLRGHFCFQCTQSPSQQRDTLHEARHVALANEFALGGPSRHVCGSVKRSCQDGTCLLSRPGDSYE
jgi:hypothetical protein